MVAVLENNYQGANKYYDTNHSNGSLQWLPWLLIILYQGHISNKEIKVTFVMHVLADIAWWKMSATVNMGILCNASGL